MSDKTIDAKVSDDTRQYLKEWADAVDADLEDVAGDAIEQFLSNGGYTIGPKDE